MTPIQQQKFNTVVGGLFVGAGVIAWLMAVAFSVLPNEKAPAPVTMAPFVDLKSCANTLTDLGYVAEVRASDVVAYEPLAQGSLDGLQRQLAKATVAWTICKLEVQNFCMGPGCERADLRERPGVNLVLRGPVGTPRGMAVPSREAPALGKKTLPKKG